MLKATGTSAAGRRFVLLGLSDINLDKLRQGKPIHVFGPEVGLDADLILFSGPTEDEMAKELVKLGGIRNDPPGRQ